MKIKKEPIREDRYLNLKLDTYPMDFTVLDSIFYDLSQFAYCVMLNDGEKDIVLEYSSSKQEALQRHKEHYDRMILRPKQWFDVKNRKFKYVTYKDIDVEEKLTDIVTIDPKDLYSAFIKEIQQTIVNGTNNGLTFYTKREATDYSRKVAFCIFSGLRVKIGQLKNTSYADLSQSDVRAVDAVVKSANTELASRFLSNLYNAGSEEHERWEMFVDLVEARIAEYFRDGNRSTKEAPNYVILPEILKEIEERIALTKKDSGSHGGGDGPAFPEYERRVKENVVGKFYVDEKCIVCDACAATAPKFFKLNEQNAFVFKQPSTPEEIDLCNKAMAGCPVAAIGSDGDVKASAGTATTVKTESAPTPKVEEKITTPVEVKVETPSVDVNDLKNLLDSVPADKLAEIQALIKSSVGATEEKIEVSQVVEEVKPEVPVDAPVSGGAKALPTTAPDGSKVYPENVAGMFYVDEKCIECDACVGAAPNFFVIEGGHAYVFAQPTNDKEIAECQEAMAGCPVSAININS